MKAAVCLQLLDVLLSSYPYIQIRHCVHSIVTVVSHCLLSSCIALNIIQVSSYHVAVSVSNHAFCFLRCSPEVSLSALSKPPVSPACGFMIRGGQCVAKINSSQIIHAMIVNPTYC